MEVEVVEVEVVEVEVEEGLTLKGGVDGTLGTYGVVEEKSRNRRSRGENRGESMVVCFMV